MAQKITHWLLIILVISLGFGQLLRFEVSGLPLFLHDILVLIILALHIYKVRNLVNLPGIKIFFAGLTLGWGGAVFICPLSSLLIPSLYTLRLLAYLALFAAVRASRIIIPRSVLLVSALTCSVIGLMQYFLLPDMRVFQYLGWDDHLNRLTLPHFDPTYTGVMIGLALLSITQLTSWYFSLLLIFAILLTYSRSVWLSLALTLSYFMLKEKKLIPLLIGACLLFIPILFLPKKFGEGTNLLRTYSISSRIQSDLSFIQKYKWDLLLGRGLNTLILDAPSGDRPIHATGPNNSYLYLLLTTGVMGLVGWGIFMRSLYLKSIQKPMFIFFFIASLFNNVMFYPFALLWILLMEAMAPSEP